MKNKDFRELVQKSDYINKQSTATRNCKPTNPRKGKIFDFQSCLITLFIMFSHFIIYMQQARMKHTKK